MLCCHAFALAPGDLDVCFGTGGKVLTTTASIYDFKAGNGMVIQSDGKIIVAGNAFNGTDEDFALVRYNVDGTPDCTFGLGGMVIMDFGDDDDVAHSVALQSDGKIVVAGYTFNGTDEDFALARYNCDGTPDSTFGTDGKVTTDFGGACDVAHSVTVQSNGKIVVAGYSKNGPCTDFAVARYDCHGVLDSTFGTGGKVTTDFCHGDDVGYSVVVQNDGKIVVAGYSCGDFSQFALARYDCFGVLDDTFGTGGKVTTAFGSLNAHGYSVVLQCDGKIVVTGDSCNGTDQDFALARYDTCGVLDNTFGICGKVTTDFGNGDDVGHSVVIQADGKIIVAGVSGSSSPKFGLARYDACGCLDRSFGDCGKVTTAVGSSGSQDYGLNVAVQCDGKVVVAGYSHYLGSDFVLARYVGDPRIEVQQPAGTCLVDGSSVVDFGDMYMFNGAIRTFKVKNRGTSDLTLSDLVIEGDNPLAFQVTATPSSTTLAPGCSTTFTVTFTPASVGDRTAMLHIPSNDPDTADFDVEIQGMGVLESISPATTVGSSFATLNGIVDPDGASVVAYFRYGTSTSYTGVTTSFNVIGNNAATPVAFNLAGLAKGTTYHYQLVLNIGGNLYYSLDQTFTTSAAASPPAWHSAQVTGLTDPNLGNAASGFRTGVARDSLNLYYFKGTDNNVWCVYWTGSAWVQSQLSSDGNVGDWLAFGTSYKLLCYQGVDGNLCSVYHNGSQWVTVQLGTPPSGITVAGDVVVDNGWNIVYYRGSDSRVYAVQWNGSAWVHTGLGGTATIKGNLAVDPTSHLIYYQGTDNHLWCEQWAGGAWHQVKLTTTANVAGSVAVDFGGMFAYYRAADSSAWCVYWNGAAWAQVQLDVLANMNTSPTCFGGVAPYPQKYDTLYLDGNGKCQALYWSGTQWTHVQLGDGGWNLTGSLSFQSSTKWTFAQRNDGNVVVFYYQ